MLPVFQTFSIGREDAIPFSSSSSCCFYNSLPNGILCVLLHNTGKDRADWEARGPCDTTSGRRALLLLQASELESSSVAANLFMRPWVPLGDQTDEREHIDDGGQYQSEKHLNKWR
uniref:Uncharacterized protein n=1 Tax=Nelumbo nucifera TaxID=4432 RepID=A0A822YBY0_NELNU|nr:TPA_asm: hypothetical protein HUJ06_030489 [Nelumbo nucifera]